MINLIDQRQIADKFLEVNKLDQAYVIYDEINNQIWTAIAIVQQGLTDFTRSYLTHNVMSGIEFKNRYSPMALNSIFVKRFDMDSDQTLNEFTFSLYGHLNCISNSKEIQKKLDTVTILNEFLTLYSLIHHAANEKWVNYVLQIQTPVIEDNHLIRLRPNYNLERATSKLAFFAPHITYTDWNHLNHMLIDYLTFSGQMSSTLFKIINEVSGTRKNKRKKQYSRYEKYERYERYEKYEKYESFEDEKEFDPKKATEDEKAKYYGSLLELKGLVTKSQIKKQYLDLITKYHPDKVSNMGSEIKDLAEKKSKDINEAFLWFKQKYKL